METKKEAKLNMYHAVIELCENNLLIIATVVAFETAYTIFKTTVSAIVSSAAQIEAQTGGYAVSKKKAKEQLATFGAGVAGLVSAYASSINDEVMKGAMHISRTDILRAKDDEVVMICRNIYDTANANAVALVPFGVTAAVLSSFDSTIIDYSGKAPKPRLAVNQKKGVKGQVDTLFKDADKLLKEQMDKLSIAFAGGNDVFLGAFKSARIIINPSTFSTVLKVQVLNTANDAPMKGVQAAMSGMALVKKSSDKGFITYKDAEEGTHAITFKKKGFVNKVENNIVVAHGKKQTIVVKMVAV